MSQLQIFKDGSLQNTLQSVDKVLEAPLKPYALKTQVQKDLNTLKTSLTQTINTNVKTLNTSISNLKKEFTSDLQDLKNEIQSDTSVITNITNNIIKNENAINNITQNISQNQEFISSVTESTIQQISHSVQEDLFVTTQNSTLIGREPITFLNIAGNSSELQDLKSKKFSMQDIFKTWYQFVHLGNNQNLESQQAQKIWQYHSDWDAIRSHINTSSYIGFISNDSYQNFNMRIKCISAGTDNDMASIIVGFTRDSSGIEHTLSVCRSYGKNIFSPCWQLVYDYTGQTNTTRRFNLLQDSTYNPSSGDYLCIANQSFVMFEVKKEGNTLTARTGVKDSETLDESTKFTFTLPKSKPSSWTQDMWNNIKQMFTSTRIGFGNTSWDTYFHIEEQNFIKETRIFSLVDGTFWNLVNGTWVQDKSSSIDSLTRNYSLVYSAGTKKLYYYLNGNFQELALS